MTPVTAFANDLNNLHQDIAQQLSMAETARPDAEHPRAHYSAIDTFLATASRHNAAMVTAIEPLVHRLPGGHELAHEFLAASRTYEEALSHVKAKLYGSSYVDRSWSSIWKEVHEHFDAVSDLERRMAHDLLDQHDDLATDDGTALGTLLHDAEMGSPTRPHPWIPHHGVVGRLARAAARRVDGFWDAAEGRIVLDPVRPRDRET
jgi:hypothetical protein